MVTMRRWAIVGGVLVLGGLALLALPHLDEADAPVGRHASNNTPCDSGLDAYTLVPRGGPSESHLAEDITPSDAKRWRTRAVKLDVDRVPFAIRFWFADGRLRSAYVEWCERGVRLVVDGKPGGVYPDFYNLRGPEAEGSGVGPWFWMRIGPRGRRVAYMAMLHKGMAMVIDHVAGPALDSVEHPVFSPDGKRAAYFGIRAGKRVVVVDGKVTVEEPLRDGAALRKFRNLGFSGDGVRVAFIEQVARPDEDGRERVWIDGQPQAWFRDIREFTFSPNGGEFAYVGVDSEPRPRMRLVRGSAAGPDSRVVRHPTFSPDGKRLAYYATGVGGSGLYVDGVHQVESGGDFDWPPVFSADGKHVAHIARLKSGWHVVVDGRIGRAYDDISNLGFAPGTDTAVYLARTGEARCIVIGSDEGPDGKALSPIAFTADGSRYGYWMQGEAGRAKVVIDGKEIDLGNAAADVPMFSPGGSGVAYRVLGRGDGAEATASEGICHWVADGEKGPAFEGLVHAPNLGRRSGGGVFSVRTVHGLSGYDLMDWFDQGSAHFVDDQTLRYVAIRDGAYYLVEAKRAR